MHKHSNSETVTKKEKKKEKKDDWICLQYEETNYSHQLLSGKSAQSATEWTGLQVYLRAFEKQIEKRK